MFKKILLGSALAVGGTATLLGTSAFSYIRTGVHTIRKEVKSQIPVEVEIQRCRDMITQIDPEIANNLQAIAREEVEIERLQREVGSKKNKLETAKSHIMRLRNDLSEERPHYVYASRTYTPTQVRQDLSRCFDRFKVQEANVEQLDKILVARERKLEVARANLEAMLASKRKLEVEVENLEARNTMVKIAASNLSFSLDDSQLARTRDLMTDIETRIEVAEKMSAGDEVPIGAIPIETTTDNDLLTEITAHFESHDQVAVAKVDAEAADQRELSDL